MSLIICGRCRGEEIVWDDREGRDVICPDCGGNGYVEEYQEDEWHEDYDYYELPPVPLLQRVKNQIWFWWYKVRHYNDPDYIPF